MKRTRMAEAGKCAVSAGTMLLLAIGLGGCKQLDREWVQERQDNLNAAVAEFPTSTLGEVTCEGSGGKPTPNNGFTHFFVIEGDDIVAKVATHLEAAGYLGTHRPDIITYSREDGITIEGYSIGDSDYADELKSSLIDSECSVPTTDAIWVQFRERIPTTGTAG
ncbi:hypothetical protein [Salinibacterium sp. SWN248]|uniref:hypothetical protein n=1 Tax=Salinibacterium sp. SWN248 TaxID=2792056 RepID=UPI0018CF3BD1|nr:hypothetical protein [Salinibacterium sp. SWN248]MBH0023046.1 hypothetical protein [Salinibacterium sp. SWN248]